jgi:pimeloyl-ACP methyl ester carboxylesterase
MENLKSFLFIIWLLTPILTFGYSKEKQGSPPVFNFVEVKGLYATSNGMTILVNPSAEFTCFTIIETGETHAIRQSTDGSLEFSKTRSSFDRIGSKLEFHNEGGKKKLTILFNNGIKVSGIKGAEKITPYTFNINDSVMLAGEYIEPPDFRSNKVAVLLHGDGRNDRYDLYDIGMHLVNSGIAIFIFDKRNTGGSSGPKIKGNNYDIISRQEANDIVGLLKYLKKDLNLKGKSIGVVGHSQGGWLGAIASSAIADLAFYVNVAGNVSDGWKQFRHYSICLLKRNGFIEIELSEAEKYINLYFDYYLGKIEKSDLAEARNSHEGKTWIKFLESKKSGFKLSEVIQKKEEPSRKEAIEDLKEVQCPSLGVFFEFDHSSPPETPIDFLTGILQSKNKNVTVKVFTGANHGMWGVSGYNFVNNEITSRDPEIFKFIADWIIKIKR